MMDPGLLPRSQSVRKELVGDSFELRLKLNFLQHRFWLIYIKIVTT